MNARPPTKFMHGAATWSVHTHPGWFRVELGDDFRIISRDGSGFIAWIGHQFKAWHFTKALDVCVEDMEHHASLHAEAAEKYRAFVDRINRATDAEIDAVMAAREQELAGLSVNSVGRADMLREDIRIMQESRARQSREGTLTC